LAAQGKAESEEGESEENKAKGDPAGSIRKD
jgi:hypothetical protein